MPKKTFNKTSINFWVDVFLLVVFLLLCWASMVTRFVFPVATKSEGWTLWGLDYLAWIFNLGLFVSCWRR